MSTGGAPMELVDSFRWEKRSKIITRDVHGVCGLMNFTHFSHLTAEPSTPLHIHSGIMEIHCIVKGRSMARLYKDGETQTITYTGGEALVVFPGEYHARGNESLQEPCELFAVQLNLVDVRPCQRIRSEAACERALYEKLTQDSPCVSPEEAGRLLPARAEFVAVWRYLMANHHDGLLQEDFLCMSRKIARSAGLPITVARTRICLDVFAERGLIQMESCVKQLRIRIVSDGRKVDLDESPIVRRLRAAKCGKRP